VSLGSRFLPVMRQVWRHLLFVHWRVPRERLAALLPAGLAVDTFEGQAFVGLVPFTIRGVRPPLAPPLPLLSRFHEVNLRTYVRAAAGETGVYFFSLDAASRLAVVGARAAYRLPYHFARMRMTIEPPSGARARSWTRYSSRRLWPEPTPATCDLRYAPREALPSPARPGTLDHFLVERYRLYASAAGRLWQARVSHSPYALQPAILDHLDETLSAAAGLPPPQGALVLHYSPGVAVRVSAPSRLEAQTENRL
jgi:uncharacterized protein